MRIGIALKNIKKRAAHLAFLTHAHKQNKALDATPNAERCDSCFWAKKQSSLLFLIFQTLLQKVFVISASLILIDFCWDFSRLTFLFRLFRFSLLLLDVFDCSVS